MGVRCRSVQRAHDVGLPEVVALEEQRRTEVFGQGVRIAVAQVQGGRMMAFSESAPRCSRQCRLFLVERDDIGADLGEKKREVLNGVRPVPRTQHDLALDERRSAHGDAIRMTGEH